jgi:hypothetical protein
MEFQMMARSLHPVHGNSTRRDVWRRHLLMSCAAGATLALAAHGESALAQAFQLNDANPTVQAGSVDFSRFTTPTPGSETITVNTPTAIINWNRAEADFLPQGNVATFQNGSGTSNFAVLNRIFSVDGGPVAFNGTVISRLTDISSGASLGPGGTVIFQSSGGIIVGSTAVFDIGNLVLTTLNVVDETGYGDFLFDGGLVFSGANPPYDQAVIVEPGARINATAEGSYVVLAAPRIEQHGSVYVNGNVGYLGGENGYYTVNNGLFDIVLEAGSDGNSTPIIHTGSTGGPASTGAGDPHGIYMLTTPFSSGQAVTMLLSGSIGFDEAVSASVENGQIVLSAGFSASPFGGEKYAEGNIVITGGEFTSDVFARATRNIIATSTDGALSFSGDFTATAYERVQLSAIDGAVTVGGDVSLTALGPQDFESGYGNFSSGGFGTLGVDVTGGIAEITAENGQTVTIAGNATLDASAVGEFEFDGDLDAGDGIGGTVRVQATTGGSIDIGGDLLMTATGAGAVTDYVPATGGRGQGGNATISAQNGSVTVAGGLFVDVSGTGSRTDASVTGQGASGTGGFVDIFAFNGNVSFGAAGGIVARGTGGAVEGTDDPAAIGGTGQGGSIFISASGGNVSLGPAMSIDMSGQGGAGPTGGIGRGGGVFLSASGGQLDLGVLSVAARGSGGDSTEGESGGDGVGGNVQIAAFGSPGSLITADSAQIFASGQGGNGDTGGEGQGGFIRLAAEAGGGELQFGDISADASGTGGVGTTTGGAGIGGEILISAELGYGSPGLPGIATFGNASLGAFGTGGAGGVGGGAGTGGVIELSAVGGETVFADIDARADGLGGAGGTGAGGAGAGGVSLIYVRDDGEFTFADATLTTDGIGGNGATGGTGTGGIQVNDPVVRPSGGAFVSSFGGTVTGNSVVLSSRGDGGNGATGAGGDGQGGSATVNVFNGPIAGLIDIGSATIDNSATGGAGGTSAAGVGAAGGNAFAGVLNYAGAETLSGTLRVDSLTQISTATGGAGGAGTTGAGGRGGDAFGGFIQAGGTSGLGSGDVNGVVELGSVTGDASATGGAGGANGGAGGNGAGGTLALLSRGGILTAGNVGFVANGTGGAGNGGAGGIGSGGQVVAALTTRFQTTIGSTNTIGSFIGTAGGTGGAGSSVGASQYGNAFIDVVGSTATFGSAELTTFGPDTPSVAGLAGPVFVRSQGGSLTFAALNVNSVAAVDIRPEGGTIALQGNADIVSQTSIAINATDSGVMSGGAWNLDTPGAVVISHSNRPGSAPTVNVASLTVFGSDFTASSGTLTQASQTIGVNVANLATIAGTVASPDIFIASSDIDIPGTGFLGDSTTTGITLNVNPQSAQTVIGGTTAGPGYTLTQAEANRIRTASLQIDASPTGSAPSRPADLVIRDLTVSATQTPAGGPGAINRLQISLNAGEGAGGIVQVEGAIRVENASSSSGIDIIAGERIQVINPSGSIRVLNSAGLPAGSIGMQAANIWSASQGIIDQLIENPNFEGRNDALLANDGEVQERGYIEAGDILLRVGSTLFVQNSGTADAFAGITVTQNTLTIEPASSSQIDVFAFGRRINADGSFVTNNAYFREVAFGAGSGYLSDAQFNQCFIATGRCGFGPEQPIPGGPEIIEGPIDEVEESVPPPNPDRQQFVDVSFASESLLEEPVTSGGDSGVWDEEGGKCQPDEDCEREGEGQ